MAGYKSKEMVKSSKPRSSSRTNDANLPLKEGAVSDVASCLSSMDAVGNVKETELDQELLMSEQANTYPGGGYYGYCYPVYDNGYVEWTDPNHLVQANGLEIQQPIIQPDGGSMMYYVQGFQPGYSHCAAVVPGTMAGAEGQYFYQQPYVINPAIPQSTSSPAYMTSPVGYGPELMPAYLWGSCVWDGYNVNVFDNTPNAPVQKSKSVSKMQPSKANIRGPKLNVPVEQKVQTPVLEVHPSMDATNHSVKTVNRAPNLSKGCFPQAKVPTYASQGNPGIIYGSNPINAKETVRNWFEHDKLKACKFNGAGNFKMISEQNCGPRTDNLKKSWTSAADLIVSPVGGTDEKGSSKAVIIRRDDYNLLDFPTKYDHAMFFVIKSYSEDDIHKSIKYNVWASTPNGNKRLDTAYQTAQEKMGGTGVKCPIFLFFSVNASGQFCGVAEMIGPVDFNKNMNFWQQDKWNGFFPVKWHLVKDVPNPQFRHIILENNENKPVTNSRDTQEVKFSQGSEMLNIFKGFLSRTSILDDFGFYENRQRIMQEKRNRLAVPTAELFLPKADVAAPAPDVAVISSFEELDLGSTKAESFTKLNDGQVSVVVAE